MSNIFTLFGSRFFSPVCPTGRYGDVTKLTVCKQCATGRVASTGAQSCTYCYTGYYAVAGEASCRACTPGKYNAQNYRASCVNCPDGKYTQVRTKKPSFCLLLRIFSSINFCSTPLVNRRHNATHVAQADTASQALLYACRAPLVVSRRPALPRVTAASRVPTL